MLVSDVCYSVICIYKFFFRFFSIVGYYKISNTVPHAIQEDLAVYFRYRRVYLVIPNLDLFLMEVTPTMSLITKQTTKEQVLQGLRRKAAGAP